MQRHSLVQAADLVWAVGLCMHAAADDRTAPYVPERTAVVTPGESDADAGKAYASPDRLPALNTTNAWRLFIHPSLCLPNESISLALASKCGNKPPREFANRVESGLSQAPRIREQVAEGADDDSAP